MKKFQILALVIFSLTLNLTTLGQKLPLPPSLTEKSSLEEILNWLDKTNLSEARIGLESNAAGVEQGEIPTSGSSYYELAIFSKGFKFAKVEGCKLFLKNDDVELLSFSTKYPNPTEGSLQDFRKYKTNQLKFAGEFTIPLNKLKANKAPFRHTKKADDITLLGAWRTEFKWKTDFFLIPTKDKLKSLMENALKIEIDGVGQDIKESSMNGDELTFTFDDEKTSKNFYAAMSRAITLCKDK